MRRNRKKKMFIFEKRKRERMNRFQEWVGKWMIEWENHEIKPFFNRKEGGEKKKIEGKRENGGAILFPVRIQAREKRGKLERRKIKTESQKMKETEGK